MDRCSSCGASLSQQIDWCGLCLTSKAALVVALSLSRRPLRPVALLSPPLSVPVRLVIVPEVEAEPARRSIFRATETDFGLLGKTMISAVLVAAGVAFWLLLDAVWDEAGATARALQMTAIGIYSAAAALILVSVWRRRRRVEADAFDRKPRLVRVEGSMAGAAAPRSPRSHLSRVARLLVLDLAEPPGALLEVADRLVEVLAIEVGPEHRREPELEYATSHSRKFEIRSSPLVRISRSGSGISGSYRRRAMPSGVSVSGCCRRDRRRSASRRGRSRCGRRS